MTDREATDAPHEHPRVPGHDPLALREAVRAQWHGGAARPPDLWLFGYASLIWRPDFDPAERHPTRVHGWHRALAMWSRVNRGTPQVPGLVFALLPGGSCQGVLYRVHRRGAEAVFDALWAREMPSAIHDVYEPRWLACPSPHGPVRALAFTLPRHSPSHTGTLSPAQYREIFRQAHGRYGSTLDYARQTLASLGAHGVRDRRLEALLRYAEGF